MKPTSLLAVLFLALAPSFAQADSSEGDSQKSSEQAKTETKASEGDSQKSSEQVKTETKASEGDSLLGGKDSTVQVKVRPLGLSIVDTVKQAGSDAASAAFQKDTLPPVINLLNQKLGECKSILDTSSMALDPSRLRLTTDANVRVYFIGEGAGYHNTLGFNVNAYGVKEGDPKLIFPDASSYLSTYNGDGSKNNLRDASNPLLPGDFVNLGKMSKGSMLDFFLISAGATGGKSIFSTDASANPDHLNHVVAFAKPDSPYLIISFEDMLGGGDRDYNDVIIAVDIGKANVGRLVSTPEPALSLVLGSFLGSVLLLDWRQRRPVRLPALVRVQS